METLLMYLLKMVICSAILFAYYRVALYNEHFHQWNRFYLLASMLLSVIVPFINIPLYTSQNENSVNYIVSHLPWNTTTPVPTPVISANLLSISFYALVSFVFLFSMLKSMFALFRLYRAHKSINLKKNIRLVLTDLSDAPFSFFTWLFWRKDIDLNSQNGIRMLNHELAHIRQYHSIDKLFTSLLICLFWMNPFYWLMRRELNMIHEFMADKKAIGQQNGNAFAQMILETFSPSISHSNSLTNPFFSSQIKRRLLMITSSKNPSYIYLRRISGLIVMICSFAALGLSIQQADAQEPAKKLVKKEKIITNEISDTSKSVIKKNIEEKKIIKGKNGQDKMIRIEKKIINKDGEMTIEETEGEDIDKEIFDMDMKNPPLYILNGKEVEADIIKSLDKNTITTVDVFKGDMATEKYGVKAKNGVVKINTGSVDADNRVEKPTKVVIKSGTKSSPIFYLDGKEITTEEMNNIKPNDIESINVLKGGNATKKYGEKAKDGVVEITLKKVVIK